VADSFLAARLVDGLRFGRLLLVVGSRRLRCRFGLAGLLRLGLLIGGGCFLVAADQQGDRGVHRHALGTLFDQQSADPALVDRLDLHGRLVGLDFGQDVTRLDLVAFFDEPFGEFALGHRRRQGRHQYFDRHGRFPVSCRSGSG
jgi:hypothetical protein